MKRRLLSMWALLVATAAALAAGGVGIATGAIPDGNRVITACMLKNVGTVRLIDKSLPASSALGHCTSLEREVTWNHQGLAGTNGTNGKDGLNGTDGTHLYSGRGRGERVAVCRLQQSDGAGNSLSHHHSYLLRQTLTSTGDRTRFCRLGSGSPGSAFLGS